LKLASDSSFDVRLQLAITVSPFGSSETDAALARILNQDADKTLLRDGLISGLRGRELEFLQHMLASSDWSSQSPGRAASIKALSQCVIAEGIPRRVENLLALAAQQSGPTSWRQLPILDAFPEPISGRRPKLIMISAEPTSLLALRSQAKDPLQAALDKTFTIVHWPGQAGYKPPPPPPPLSAEERTRFNAGKVVFGATCIQCHKVDGRGQEGTAPPLVDSEWVLGSPNRLVRIVTNGLHGPITVGGKSYSLDMPSFQSMRDEDVAAVLTYVRREWDHEASPVAPELVKKIRAELSQRTYPWTERELLKIP
jgi:mono/diheme cytochrome c family protein